MVNLKDAFKLISVMVLTFCSVFVCTIFVNYPLDLKGIAHLITDAQTQAVYDAQMAMSSVIMACTGGVLGAVTLLVLIFSISRFINENSAHMGVMKALGYSDNRIAVEFSKFGLSVLSGSVLAFVSAYIFSPLFYNMLDSAGELPVQLTFGYHIETLLIMIAAPALLFSALSVLYAKLCLRKSPLELINGSKKSKINKLTQKLQGKESGRPFLRELKRTILFNNLLLIFFVGFAAFGFSAQIQLSFSMRQLTSNYLMTVILIVIGIILGAVTLLIALTFVINANRKYIAMLKAYGHTDSECNNAMFGGYRIVAYIGFGIGTGYQFFLLKMMASIFTKAYDFIPEMKFNFIGFFITLAVFAFAYEIIMLLYKRRITKIPLREIMQA